VETFITSYVIFTGLALVLSSPITYVAWRNNRMKTMRNFMIGSFAVALPCAILDVVSERQMAQCLDAGISECLDIGRAGLQFLFIGMFAVAAWFSAFFMWRD
jgi:nucleoside permease NupC